MFQNGTEHKYLTERLQIQGFLDTALIAYSCRDSPDQRQCRSVRKGREYVNVGVCKVAQDSKRDLKTLGFRRPCPPPTGLDHKTG